MDLKTFGVQEGQDKYHEEILYSLALLYNLVSHGLSNFLKKYNLTIGKLNILLVIKHVGRDEGIAQVEISKHLIVTPSNMTKMVDKLEQEKLVNRLALEGDRRVNIVKITPRGSELLNSLWEGYQACLAQAVHYLDKGKQKQLAILLKEWLGKLR